MGSMKPVGKLGMHRFHGAGVRPPILCINGRKKERKLRINTRGRETHVDKKRVVHALCTAGCA